MNTVIGLIVSCQNIKKLQLHDTGSFIGKPSFLKKGITQTFPNNLTHLSFLVHCNSTGGQMVVIIQLIEMC